MISGLISQNKDNDKFLEKGEQFQDINKQEKAQNVICVKDKKTLKEEQKLWEIRQKGMELEEKIFSFSGLSLFHELHIYDVKIFENDWIHTIQIGHQHQDTIPVIVLHGFGNSNVNFFKMVKIFSEDRKTYLIDLPGFGLSSRPRFEQKGAQNALDFLVGWLDQFLQTLNLKKVILVGHSFGGYLSGSYACKFPEKVALLHLVSPVGVNFYSEEDKQKHEENLTQRMGYFRKIFFNFARNAYQNQETYTSVYQKWWVPSKFFLKGFVSKRLKLEGEQSDVFCQYYDLVYKMEVSCEKSFNELFSFPRLAAHISLEQNMPNKILCPTHFYFGDQDWMDSSGAKRLIKGNRLPEGSTFDIIQDAGHNINLDNPQLLAHYISKYNKIHEKIEKLQK